MSASSDHHPLESARREYTTLDNTHSSEGPIITEKERDEESKKRRPNKIVQTNISQCLQPKNKTLRTIRNHTEAYLERGDVKGWLEECASKLVEGRRNWARSNPQRWERACFGAWYTCNVDGCQRGEKKYPQRKDMLRHLKDKHRDLFRQHNEELEEQLNKCKIVVR